MPWSQSKKSPRLKPDHFYSRVPKTPDFETDAELVEYMEGLEEQRRQRHGG